jgi:hypothetical protein
MSPTASAERSGCAISQDFGAGPVVRDFDLRILRGEPVTALEWGINLGAGVVLVALVWWLAARLYHREQLAISA